MRRTALILLLAALPPPPPLRSQDPPPTGPFLATRLVGEEAALGPRLFLPPLRLALSTGIPSLSQALPSHHGPPLHATLNLLGRPSPLVLLCSKTLVSPCGSHKARPDTLLLDLHGDRRFTPAETHTITWPQPKEHACPHCGHASLRGQDLAATPTLDLAGRRLLIQLKARGGKVEAYLIRRNWRSGMGMIAGHWHRLLYQDRNLDGKVDGEDRWLLAGLGDRRLRDRLLGGTRLRGGTTPFPYPGGKGIRLDRIDAEGRARFTLLPTMPDIGSTLHRRADEVRRRWARELALDDAQRRILLGLPPGPTGARRQAPWRHVAATRLPPPRPGRPRLLWLDEEESTSCRRLEHYTLGEPSLAAAIEKRCDPVRIHLGLCPHDPRAAYGVVAVPALVLLDDKGKARWRSTGFITPAALLQALRKYASPAKGGD